MFVPKRVVDIVSALVQVMACCLAVDTKPLPEPSFSLSINEFMQYLQFVESQALLTDHYWTIDNKFH